MGQKHASYTRRRHGLTVQLLALIPGAVFLMLFTWRAGFQALGERQFTLFDDAMISMTYARTLVETGEWVWFPGAERVQGFTNPLWTAYMALLHLVGLNGSLAALAVSLTGAALLLMSAMLVAWLVNLGLDDWQGGLWASAIAGGTVPFLYPLSYWTLRGMEVGLLSFLALVMVFALSVALRRWGNAMSATSALIACAATGVIGIGTRLDFAVIAMALAACLLTWAPGRRSRWFVMGILVAPLLVTGVLVLCFQHVYWGDWLTNTYRLKMEGFSLADRAYRGAVSAGKALPLFSLIIFGLVVTLRHESNKVSRRLVIALFIVALVAFTYSIWVGGDAWESFGFLNRYVTVALPACLAVTIIGLGQFVRFTAISELGRRLSSPLAILSLSGLGVGMTTNPFGISTPHALAHGMTLGAVALITLCALRLADQPAPMLNPAITVLTAAAVAVFASTSALPFANWVRYNAEYVDSDEWNALNGRELARVTEPDARIAVLSAGAVAYNAHRPMVDLLGKSDREIAIGPPASLPSRQWNSTFYPGHNKWNYAYSIGELKPDVVYQTWGESEVLEQLADWGYVKRCLSDRSYAYFLVVSVQIRWHELSPC